MTLSVATESSARLLYVCCTPAGRTELPYGCNGFSFVEYEDSPGNANYGLPSSPMQLFEMDFEVQESSDESILLFGSEITSLSEGSEGCPTIPNRSPIEDEASDDGPRLKGVRLRACPSCRDAKTACDDERPCKRCRRLGIPCEAVSHTIRKRLACVNCKRSKVLCDLSEVQVVHGCAGSCSRCARLGLECAPPTSPAPRGRKPPQRKQTTRGVRPSDGA